MNRCGQRAGRPGASVVGPPRSRGALLPHQEALAAAGPASAGHAEGRRCELKGVSVSLGSEDSSEPAPLQAQSPPSGAFLRPSSPHWYTTELWRQPPSPSHPPPCFPPPQDRAMMATTCASCGVVALLATVSAVPATVTVPVTVVVDTAANPTPFEHFWKKTFGSGHARLTLREDWQLHLKQARDELGLGGVRYHGIFDDDMGVVVGHRQYNWTLIDASWDFQVSLGLTPVVELSFMPALLADCSWPSGTVTPGGTPVNPGKKKCQTVMHYQGVTEPPKDFDEWYQLVHALGTHAVERYGAANVSTWSFEVVSRCVICDSAAARQCHLVSAGYESDQQVLPSACVCARWVFVGRSGMRCGAVRACLPSPPFSSLPPHPPPRAPYTDTHARARTQRLGPDWLRSRLSHSVLSGAVYVTL